MKGWKKLLTIAVGFCLLVLMSTCSGGGGCLFGEDDDDDDNDDDDNNDDNDTGDDDDASPDEPDDDDSVTDDEPPINPYLADSPWPMAHRNPYCQASSPYPGPEPGDKLVVDHLLASPVPAFLLYSSEDPQGTRAVWTTTLFDIYTIDAGSTPLVEFDSISKNYHFGSPLAGEYSILDLNGTFFAPQADRIHAFANENPADVRSPIREINFSRIPEPLPQEAILGINLMYDGMIAFATTAGRVGVVSRDLTEWYTLMVNQEPEEELYNTIAADEDGGVYVVTTRRMYRVQWTGDELTMDEAEGAWSAAYEHGPDIMLPGRISIGSGTTPSLMGCGEQDKFVVICDSREVMRIVLFWRDEIPSDWEPIAPEKDRRIAAEVPVDFGDPNAAFTSTEQSILIRGYDAVVVNNYYGPDAVTGIFAAMFSNLPQFAPYGAQKFTWDPDARQLTSSWANPDVSCPNSVPTMSSASGLMYCIGQRDTVWTLEAVDWETGASAFHFVLGDNFKYNSYYAGTEIGPDRNIINGAVYGVLDIRPRPKH